MKTTPVILLSLLGLCASLSLAAADAPKTYARAQVIFFEPDRFTDVKDSYMGSDKGRDAILDQLRDYIQERAKVYVADGLNLTVTVTDVDLAGDFEPARGGRWMDVRIVKDIYPPRIELSFQLTAPDGTVLKQGERKLTDTAFQMKLSINTNDALRYEKALLDDWMRTDFAKAR
jgi:Protein of unknown function (DUF3016)